VSSDKAKLAMLFLRKKAGRFPGKRRSGKSSIDTQPSFQRCDWRERQDRSGTGDLRELHTGPMEHDRSPPAGSCQFRHIPKILTGGKKADHRRCSKTPSKATVLRLLLLRARQPGARDRGPGRARTHKNTDRTGWPEPARQSKGTAVFRSIHRIHHFEHRIRELSEKYRSLAEFIE
jgi:hypothetical protein